MPKQIITPFLWFERDAEKAAKFYVSIFGGASRILQVTRYTQAGPGPKGSVMTVAFRLGSQKFVGLNGGRPGNFNEAVSFVVECGNQAEIDRYWRRLSKGGKEIQCGWLRDRYGVRWQVVPSALGKLLDARHSDRVSRVMEAVFGMVKLDIATLKRAYAGTGG